MIPTVSRDQLIAAMERFDRELRETESWRNREQRGNHRYAIEHNGRRYPVKQIISMATGLAVSTFSGGQESNRHVMERGFSVVALRAGVETAGDLSDRLQDGLDFVLTRGKDVIRPGQPARDKEIRDTFRGLRDAIRSLDAVKKREHLVVDSSAGMGLWSNVPWIALLDRRETRTTQQGVYCVFLFRQDMSGVYLTFNQGVTMPKKQLGARPGLDTLRRRAQSLRPLCDGLARRGFQLDEKIDLRCDPGLGTDYEAATVAYKLYAQGSIPTDSEISADLEAVLDAYDRYLERAEEEKAAEAGDESEGQRSSGAWIFQANPRLFELDKAIRKLPEITFTVRQHAEQIQRGDRVFLWEAGRHAGIVGTAGVQGDVGDMPHGDEERAFDKSGGAFDGIQRRVRLHIEQILSARLLRDELQQHPVLTGFPHPRP